MTPRHAPRLPMTGAVLATLTLTMAFSLVPAASAQTAGSPRQIQLVVPFSPGGSTDLFARVIAPRLSARLGLPVVVDNKPGAGGMLGADFLSRAPADGSTLMLTASDLSTGAAVQKSLAFDPEKGLATVSMLATGPMVVVVNSASPYRSIEQLMTAARQSPGQLNYGSAGIGSLHHLSGELFASMAKVDMTHVPYKGSAPAVQDLVAARIQTMIASFPATLAQVKGERLRILAVTSPTRARFAPELPTVASVVPGYQVEIWWGIFAPGATPSATLDRLNAEFRGIVTAPELRETLEREGAEPTTMNAAESHAFYLGDIEKWRGIARTRRITLD